MRSEAKVPKLTNDVDQMLATLRFRKAKNIETVALVEEIKQLRGELAEAAAIMQGVVTKDELLDFMRDALAQSRLAGPEHAGFLQALELIAAEKCGDGFPE